MLVAAVFYRIHQQFIDDQRERHGRLFWKIPPGHFAIDRYVAAEQSSGIGADRANEILPVHVGRASREIVGPLRGSDRPDASDCIRQHLASFRAAGMAVSRFQEANEYLQVVLEPMVPLVEQLFAQRNCLSKLILNALGSDGRHIGVCVHVEAVSKFAHGSNVKVSFWKLTLNHVNLYLRLISVAPKARLPQPDVGEGPRAGEHQVFRALADRCVFALLESTFQKVLTTRVASRERETRDLA